MKIIDILCKECKNKVRKRWAEDKRKKSKRSKVSSLPKKAKLKKIKQ